MLKIMLKYLLINILFVVGWTTLCLILLGPPTSSIFKIAHIAGAILFGVAYAGPNMSAEMSSILLQRYIDKEKKESEDSEGAKDLKDE